MTNETALQKIRTLLGFASEEVETNTESTEAVVEEVVFASAASEDGTIFQVEGEWEVGKEVVIVLEDGTTPSPSGVFDLDNGYTITIEDGILTAVEETPASEEEEAPVQDETAQPTEEQMSDEQLVELISKIVKEVKDQMSAELAEVKSLVEASQTEVKNLETELENFKKAPAAKKITNSAFDNLKDYSNSSDIQFSKLKELKSKLNK